MALLWQEREKLILDITMSVLVQGGKPARRVIIDVLRNFTLHRLKM